MLLNIFFLQHILPVLCLPCFKFFFFNPTTLQDLTTNFFSFPQVCMCYSLFSQNNCLRNEISTYLVKFLWQYEFNALQIITLAPLTPFVTHGLATSLFPVSCDLPSGNDIGLHTIRLLLTFDSWLSLLARCNLKTYLFLHILENYTHMQHIVSHILYLTHVNTNTTLCDVLSLSFAFM